MSPPVLDTPDPGRAMTPHLGDPPARACLDLARGVLIGLTGCSPAQAFTALTHTAHHHDVPVFALAAALTTTAQHHGNTTGLDEHLATAVTNSWGLLWPQRVTGTGPTS